MCLISTPKADNSASEKAAADSRAAEEARQRAIDEGKGKIDTLLQPYNDEFYSGKTKDYLDYYTPQAEKQYTDAKQTTLFNNANKGTLNSSAYAKNLSDLAEKYGLVQQNIQSGAQDYTNTAKQNVESLRSNMLNQLQASADPNSVSAASLNSINIPPASSLSPLVNMFTDVAQSAGNIGTNTALMGYPSLYQKYGYSNSGNSKSSVNINS